MIPINWSQVTLENYYPFERTMAEDEFKGWENLTNEELELKKLDLRVKRACFLSDMEVEDIMKLSIEELGNVDILMNTPYPTKAPRTFKFKGRKYKVLLDPRKWDAWRYQAIMNECRIEGADNLHKLMYLVTVEIKKRKEVEVEPDEIEARINEFKQLPVSIANPIGVFFWNLSRELMEIILSYSEQEMKTKKMEIQEVTDSLKNMDG